METAVVQIQSQVSGVEERMKQLFAKQDGGAIAIQSSLDHIRDEHRTRDQQMDDLFGELRMLSSCVAQVRRTKDEAANIPTTSRYENVTTEDGSMTLTIGGENPAIASVFSDIHSKGGSHIVAGTISGQTALEMLKHMTASRQARPIPPAAQAMIEQGLIIATKPQAG